MTCLAKCNGAEVSMHRFGSFSLETFREIVKQSCQTGTQHVVVSYGRRKFRQTGDGHFSPLGGYHRGQDLTLILDTVDTPRLKLRASVCRRDLSIRRIGCHLSCSMKRWVVLIRIQASRGGSCCSRRWKQRRRSVTL